jgi:hypothetical protein
LVERYSMRQKDVHEYMVPFSRILGVYWGDSREREILCNLSDIPATLLSVGEIPRRRQGRKW